MGAANTAPVPIVRELPAHKADFRAADRIHKTALVYAAGQGEAAVLVALLEAGDDPNQRDVVGATPLMWAAAEGRTEAIAVLLAHKADTQLRDDRGMTALAIAREQKQEAAVKALEQAP
jgi:hypothetical protein